MFNFRKKPDEPHPVTDVFSNLTQNQKMSVINLLATVVYVNRQDGSDRKLAILGEYLGYLGVKADSCNEYRRRSGHEGMISDLLQLSKNQKELLVVSAQDIILCSQQPDKEEIITAASLFEEIGIDEQQFIEIIQKARALMKFFS